MQGERCLYLCESVFLRFYFCVEVITLKKKKKSMRKKKSYTYLFFHFYEYSSTSLKKQKQKRLNNNEMKEHFKDEMTSKKAHHILMPEPK